MRSHLGITWTALLSNKQYFVFADFEGWTLVYSFKSSYWRQSIRKEELHLQEIRRVYGPRYYFASRGEYWMKEASVIDQTTLKHEDKYTRATESELAWIEAMKEKSFDKWDLDTKNIITGTPKWKTTTTIKLLNNA